VAKPKPELPPAAAIRALADSEGRVALRVTPGARTQGIEIADGRILVKVWARPHEGEANAAVLALLGEALGVAASRLQMLRGATGRDKLVRLPER
jgi:uncharacterized protein